MATYAAYRHIELDNIGYGKKRVLKPPGGGSSDIFGASEPVEPQRKAKTHLTSSIFAEESATPARNKAGNSSFYNLFGSEANIKPLNNSANTSRSNISPDNSGEATGKSTKEDELQKVSSADEEAAENDNVIGTDGNVMNTNTTNGEKDDTPAPVVAPTVMNGGTTSSTNSAVSSTAPTPTNAAPNAGRARVPPGGFSSGLW